MKLILISVITLFSVSLMAEVKPDGALVPMACGANFLETIGAGPDYPDQVCLWTETVNPPAVAVSPKPIVSIQSSQGLKFYLVLGQFQTQPTQIQWQAYEVQINDSGRYMYLTNNVNVSAPAAEMTRILGNAGSPMGSISGPLFDVALEVMATTLSVPPSID